MPTPKGTESKGRISPVLTRAETRRREQEAARQQQQESHRISTGLPSSDRKSGQFSGFENEESDSNESNPDTIRENLQTSSTSHNLSNMSQNEGAEEAAAAIANAFAVNVAPVFEEITRKIKNTPTIQPPRGTIPSFNGEIPSNFYTWLRAFESIGSSDIGWSDAEKKRRISGYLIGRALGIYRNLREELKAIEETPGNTWRDLKRALEDEIITDKMRTYHKNFLPFRKQYEHEETTNFVSWLEDEVKLCYPEILGDQERQSQYIKDLLIQGSRARKELSRIFPPPATLQEAMNAIYHIEGTDMLEK